MEKSFYITTAIDYANGSPHIGHAYEKVLADVIARVQRLRGREVYFRTGLDEHGTKVLQAARAKGIEPKAICDLVAGEFQKLLKQLNISQHDYIRTTDDRHKDVVAAVLTQLKSEQAPDGKPALVFQEYDGFYSLLKEQFVLEKNKVNGEWPEDYGEVIWLTEWNYFFRLEPYRAWLSDWLQSAEGANWIFPAHRQTQVVEFLKQPLNDLCISRPFERLPWGIPLPFDAKYVTYVWFDALINYITGDPREPAGVTARWPADLHVIGKDILVPPHAVYWPIMLRALGLPLPRRLLVHGFWVTGGKKESKTDIEKAKAEGRARFNPLDVIATHGADAFRYFVLREMVLGQDAEFTHEQFTARYNSELANDFGNLVSRLLNLCSRFTSGTIPRIASQGEDDELRGKWFPVKQDIQKLGASLDSQSEPLQRKHLELFDFSTLLFSINNFVKELNRHLENTAPWKLAKAPTANVDEQQRNQLKIEGCLGVVAKGVYLCAIGYAPFMTEISKRVLELLGQPPIAAWNPERLEWDNANIAGAKLGDKAILFPKVEAAAPAPADKKA